jgi:hypothetical protein
MSDPAVVTLNGIAVRSLVLNVGNVGPWTAEVTLTEAPDAPLTRVTLAVGKATLVGTVTAQQAGAFALGYSARVSGGAAGWGRELSAKGYHNDAGVKARLLAEDAAREAGESLGSFVPSSERVGVDYVRPVGTASAVLEYAAGAQPWWVDYAGVTQVGPRATSELARDTYDLLSFDPQNRLLLLAIDDAAALQIGSVITDERLDAAQVVRDFQITTSNNSPLRATAWCGALESEPARLPGLLRALVRRITEGQLFGSYRYRVVAMAADGRVELQAVRKSAGLPDIRPISQWPGVAGAHAELAPGAEVLVQFIEGDAAQPVVTHYVGKGGTGFVPVQLTLGGDAGQPAARQGDTVEVLLPPAQFAGTINGLPATGVVTWLAPTADGTITSGSGKVRIAT